MTAVAALALLLLVPGLLVVRAPWTAVPALSLAFWALSPWWCPATLSRAGFVGGALLGSLALLALRLLPKHEQPREEQESAERDQGRGHLARWNDP